MKKTKIYIKKLADRIRTKNFCRRAFPVSLIFLILTATMACGGSGQDGSDGTAVNATPKMTSLERDIKTMQTANFKYIYVFKRKDGGVFDREDKRFLRDNSPPGVNRFVSSDEEKAFVAGSNFFFPDENLESLKERFDVQDLSPVQKPEENEDQTEKATDKQADKK